jgi:hypothetical protein
MKINGLKMHNYWFINFVFFFIMYALTAGTYWAFGKFILRLNFFADTDWRLMFIIFLGWGLCQISMAFFASVFLNDSQTASIIGYTLSIWTSIIASSLNATIFQLPHTMSAKIYPFPMFPFCRVMYLLTQQCAYGACY